MRSLFIDVRATVSGSFRRAMDEISADVAELIDAGVRVLSPSDPRVIASFGEFLFVASDVHRAVKSLQDRHLAAIRSSTFLWLVAPDGYVGPSTSFEIGAAVMADVPVFSRVPLADLTLRQYVRSVTGISDVVRDVGIDRGPEHGDAGASLLLDPHGATEQAHADLDLVLARLTNGPRDAVERDVDFEAGMSRLSDMFHLKGTPA